MLQSVSILVLLAMLRVRYGNGKDQDVFSGEITPFRTVPRPGLALNTPYGSPPISPTDLEVEIEGLSLRVTPVLESVPLGAPVRVNIELVNTTNEPIYAPKNLRMKSGLVKGQVVGPAGSVRPFSPVMRCLEDEAVAPLNPGERISDSLTLLRGAQGALFAAPGRTGSPWKSTGTMAAW